MLRLLFSVLGLTTLSLAQPSPASYEPPGSGDRWFLTTSPHFELYSTAPESETRELLGQLEILREATLRSVNLATRQPLPLTIFHFKRSSDYTAYLPKHFTQPEQILGLYQDQADRALILLAPISDQEQRQRTLYHEYIHHLIRVSGDKPPVWYEEGLAELLSTMEAKSDGLIIGKPILGRVLQLRQSNLLDIDQLLTARQDSSLYLGGHATAVLYAQAWAFVHYIYLGQAKVPKDKLFEFISLTNSEESRTSRARIQELARSTLGLELSELNGSLTRYVRGGSYRTMRLAIPDVAPTSSYTVRAAPEIRLRLAEVLLKTNRDPWAKIALTQAVREGQHDAKVLESLAAHEQREGDQTSAREYWDAAIAMGSTNHTVYDHLAKLEAERWFRDYDPDFTLPDDAADRLRYLLYKSLDGAPEQGETYEALAWVEAHARRPEISGVNLVQTGLRHLRIRDRALLALATVRYRTKDTTTAREIANLVKQSGSNPWAVAGAGQLLERMTAADANASTSRSTRD